MPGPQNPAAADPKARGGQYVTSPGFASPGQSSPSHSRTAPESTVVYSPKGWKWEEAGDNYALAASKLATSAIEAAVRRMRTTFGQVYYIKGVSKTRPPFDGETVGDTCRVQDAITLDIVAEWRWTGAAWERMQVDNQQISNLDVGKLTAGSASISELAARKIASDVGRFLELTTDQLTVTGNASFVDLTARHIWTRIVTAQVGEFETIKAGMIAANAISADNLQAGAVDGQVITGATLQTSKERDRGLKITSDGMQVYRPTGGNPVLNIDARSGSIELDGNIGISDTWSWCRFSDVVDQKTSSDVGQFGDKWGVGILMNRYSNPYRLPALVSFKDDPTNRGGILYLQAPTSGAGSPPSLRLSQSSLTGYGGGSIIGQQGVPTWGFSVSKTGYSFNAPGYAGVWGNDYTVGMSQGGEIVLSVSNTDFKLRTKAWPTTAMWGNGTNTVMSYSGSSQAVCDVKGFRTIGPKNFIMRVPGEWQKRRMMLQHACTESPYDGIEYWEKITLDDSGRATWTLPDYVPKIASEKAPWLAFTTSAATATLNRTGYGSDSSPWTVDILGKPGEVVGVLVKGARKIDKWDEETDVVTLVDNARDSVWTLPPAGPDDDVSSVLSDGTGAIGPAYQSPTKEEKQ